MPGRPADEFWPTHHTVARSRINHSRWMINGGSWLMPTGWCNQTGVVAAEDQCPYPATGFVGGQADQALFEVAGHGV
jgi:hypothetical protein